MNRIVLLLSIAASAMAADDWSTRLTAIPTETTAWQVALGDVDGDGREDAVYAGYDGEVVCLQRDTGKTLWRADVGAFPYCLRLADLDGDGADETLVTSASLDLRVFDGRGRRRWRFAPGAPLHAIAVGRVLDGGVQVVCGGNDMNVYLLSAEGKLLRTWPQKVAPNIFAIRNLVVGDVTGDDANEICFNNAFGVVRCLDPRTGKTLWNSRDYSRRYLRDLRLWDVDGDGKQEILAAGDRIDLLDGDGSKLWSTRPGAWTRARGYRMAQLAPVDLDGDGRPEMSVLYGPELSVLDRRGQRLYSQHCDYYYFTAVTAPSTPRNEIVLGSVTGADRNLYSVTFAHGGQDQFTDFTYDHGFIRTLDAATDRLRQQALAAPAAAQPLPAYRVWVVSGSPPLKQIGWAPQLLADFHHAYPYPNLEFVAFLQYRERGHTGQGTELPVDDLLSLARQLERGGAHHVLAVAHGVDAFMSLDVIRRWLEATPTTCNGLMMHENSHFINHHLDATPELRQQMDRFLDDFMIPVMDLCVAHHKRIYLMEKQAWWAGVPACEHYGKRLLAEKYRDWLVPMVEESNSRCPELNLAARLGLWRSGMVKQWGLNLIDDQLRACKFYEYTPCDAAAALRYYVAGVAAGATELKLAKLSYLFFDRTPNKRRGLTVGPLHYRPFGLRSLDTFLHLLGKGLLVAPTPDEAVGFSPVVWRFGDLDDGFWLSARMGEFARIEPASREGLFSGFDWAFVRPHPYYAPSYLMEVPRYGHEFFPANPRGLPLVVPAWLPASATSWAHGAIDTDGVHVLRNGQRLSARQAKPWVLQRFNAAARGLPFTCRNAFWMARRSAPNRYRLTLVDPGYLAPRPRTVFLVPGAGRRLTSARDLLAGSDVPLTPQRLQLLLPAGAFRIIDLELSEG